jgi:hypothetical protein
MNKFNEVERRSVIIDTEEQEDFLFESNWLSTMIEKTEKEMISEFENVIRRKVLLP